MFSKQSAYWISNKNFIVIIIMAFFNILCLSGCNLPSESSPTRVHTQPTLQNQIVTKIPSSTPFQTHKPLTQSSGPYLLIQTDIVAYKIININSGNVIPFLPPTTGTQYKLSTSISPSRQKIFFLDNKNKVLNINLISGEIISTHDISIEKTTFDPEIVLAEIHSKIPNLDFTDETLLALINSANQKSLTHITWYKNDRYWLIPIATGPSTTGLSLYDHETGTLKILETQPGILLDYWVEPGGDKLLIRKGYGDNPDFWPYENYYILDPESRTTFPVPLPDSIDNPSIFWFNADKIGIIHQMEPVGGWDFSIFNAKTKSLSQIIKGPFLHISRYKENILTIQQSQQGNNTIISLSNFQGDILLQATLENPCFYKTRIGEKVILNCETESILLDKSFNITPLESIVSLISPATDGNSSVLVNRTKDTFLMNLETLEQQKILLKGQPLEVRWLPDSSGFIYRVSGKLFLYDLGTKENKLLLVSEFFSDYTNINAVWISLD